MRRVECVCAQICKNACTTWMNYDLCSATVTNLHCICAVMCYHLCVLTVETSPLHLQVHPQTLLNKYITEWPRTPSMTSPAESPATAFQQVLHSFGLPDNLRRANLNSLIMELNSDGSHDGMAFLGSNLRVTRGVPSKGSIHQPPTDHWACNAVRQHWILLKSRSTNIQLIQLHLGQRKQFEDWVRHRRGRLQRAMALALGHRLSKCLWAATSLRHFQNEKLVITIKRPYYIADFLEKSVFYRAGLQMHTHTLLATRHRNRSEGARLGANREREWMHWLPRACLCVCLGAAGELHFTGTHTCSCQPGEETLQDGVYKKVQNNGSVILNLASEHTQLTTYLKIGSRGGGGELEGLRGYFKQECRIFWTGFFTNWTKRRNSQLCLFHRFTGRSFKIRSKYRKEANSIVAQFSTITHR